MHQICTAMEPGPDAGTGLWLGPGHPACWGTCLPGTSSSWWLEGMGFWPGLPISGGHLTFFLMPLYLFLETPLHFFGDPFTFFLGPFIWRKTQETILFRIFRKEDVFDHTVSTKVGSLASSGTAGICTFRWRAK